MNRIAYVAPILLAGLVYVNVLDNPFVYDDHRLIVENRSLLYPTDLLGLLLHESTRPVMNLSYAIDRFLFGPEPFGFHATNVGLHMLNVGLVFLLIRRVTEDRAGRRSRDEHGGPDGRRPPVPLAASIAALLFAVHPMMTQAVGYISGRSEVLCATWLLLALLAARRWMYGGGMGWLAVTGSLWLVAMGTKETAAMFPFALILFDRLLCSGSAADHRRRLVWMHLPLLGVAALAVTARLFVLVSLEAGGTMQPQWSLGLVELDVVRRYLMLMIMPRDQTVFHAVAPVTGLLDPRVIAGAASVALLIALAWRLRQTAGLAAFGLVWFLLLLAPSSALVILDRGEPMAEHRVYAASIGLFACAGVAGAWLRAQAVRRRAGVVRVITVAFLVWLAVLSGRTVLRNQIWGNPVVLWAEALDGAPDHWLPQLLLAESLQEARRCDEAVELFRASLESHPEEPTGYRRLGGCLVELSRLDEARMVFEDLRRRVPESPHASMGLGAVAMGSGQPTTARDYFLETLEHDPYSVPARQGLSMLNETVENNPKAALRRCQEIAKIAPETQGNDDCITRNEHRIANAAPGR